MRLCLLLAALLEIDVLCGDIQNAYLTAPNKEKIWMRAGPEWGSDQGKPFIIVRALYGLQSAGAAFRAFLAEKLDEMQYKPTQADPDVWIRPAVKQDGEEYYEYVLVYVDDILCMSHQPDVTMKEIANTFKWKGDSIAPPGDLLGCEVGEEEA